MSVRKLVQLFASSSTIGCYAFAPPTFRRTRTFHIRHRQLILPTNKAPQFQLHAIDSDNHPDNSENTPLFDSLPSPEAIRQNVLDGTFGRRGEPYVLAQFTLFLLLAVGYVPILGDAATSLVGSLFLLSGLYVVYRSSADLKNNLSPWPVPADPASGRGSLVDTGIYSYVRHPMYAGVLLGMAGLSVVTDSAVRVLLTCALYFVLDRKSEFEEEKLGEVYGEAYERYKEEVKGKFFPADWRKVLR